MFHYQHVISTRRVKDMIVYKTPDEIEEMKDSCRLAATTLKNVEELIVPGTTTGEINDYCHKYITDHGGTPSPLNYKGFPKSVCTSVNQVVCHGIPGDYRLREGDIINVDITAYLNGFHGDNSRTFGVGKVSRAARELMKATEEALWVGIEAAGQKGHIGDIGEAIQSFVEGKGYSIVREYCGHGIGRKFHEDPHVVHYGKRGTGAAIKDGMVFTIEPMVNMGSAEIVLLDDDWTVETKDKKLSAQFEHTIAITANGVEVLTKL